MKRFLIAALALAPILSGITQAQRGSEDGKPNRDAQIERLRELKQEQAALRREMQEMRKSDTGQRSDRKGEARREGARSRRGDRAQGKRRDARSGDGGPARGKDQQRARRKGEKRGVGRDNARGQRGRRAVKQRDGQRRHVGEKSSGRRGPDLQRRSPQQRGDARGRSTQSRR